MIWGDDFESEGVFRFGIGSLSGVTDFGAVIARNAYQ